MDIANQSRQEPLADDLMKTLETCREHAGVLVFRAAMVEDHFTGAKPAIGTAPTEQTTPNGVIPDALVLARAILERIRVASDTLSRCLMEAFGKLRLIRTRLAYLRVRR